MAVKILLDTGVFISYFDRPEDKSREEKARKLIDHIKHKLQGEIVYSQRTFHELKNKNWNRRKKFLEDCQMSKYYIGNETYDKIEGTWENIGSLFNNDSDGEFQISEKLIKFLSKDRDFRDRGILLDALKNNCDYFIHENPKDFNKIPIALIENYSLKIINLLEIDYDDIEKKIK